MISTTSQYSSETALSIKQNNRRRNFGSGGHSLEEETRSTILVHFQGNLLNVDKSLKNPCKYIW
jgi:hypothetical protein